MRHRLLLFLLSLLGLNGAQAQGNVPAISSVALPGLAITAVEEVPAGGFSLPDGRRLTTLPAFVRVAFTSRPTAASFIRSEVWLPRAGWNGRFLGTGTGGGAGYIDYHALAGGLARGFAAANTDLGTSPSVYDLIGVPERWADFGYRATHEMTVAAKAIARAYYQKAAHHAYFAGCSTGGQQALAEAQRYPDDYDGLLVGAPANNRTHLHTSFIWNLLATGGGRTPVVLSASKMALLARLLRKSGGGRDGGAPGDSFLTDPRLCAFDSAALPPCPAGAATDSCFTPAELTALRKLYAGPTNPRTGARIYAPLPLGGLRPEETVPHLYLFNWVFGKDFDYTKFDFDRDLRRVDSLLGPVLNANSPDLRRLRSRGGKILMYAGTADQLVPAPDAINYYERVVKAQGGLRQTQDFFRFFLVPGMDHCGGGPGPNDFGQSLAPHPAPTSRNDVLTALVEWVEHKQVPEQLLATAPAGNEVRPARQRPVFPYPKFPEYSGGDPARPTSYRGVAHPRGGVPAPAESYLK